MLLEQELASPASGTSENSKLVETIMKLLKFWWTLAKRGEWSVVSVEPVWIY
ncbi:MAG: hypothetical protein QXZ31_03670 [Thermofilaceae archaeon]